MVEAVSVAVMKAGEPWLGELRCQFLPRKGELVLLGSGNTYRVQDVLHEQGPDQLMRPLIILNPIPEPV